MRSYGIVSAPIPRIELWGEVFRGLNTVSDMPSSPGSIARGGGRDAARGEEARLKPRHPIISIDVERT